MSNEGRRPIEDWERPHLRSLGAAITEARLNVGRTLTDIAVDAGLDYAHLRRLISGERRTRASTLQRIAAALSSDEKASEALHAKLVQAAGPALAPESAYTDRVARRRARRLKRWAKEAEQLEAVKA